MVRRSNTTSDIVGSSHQNPAVGNETSFTVSLVYQTGYGDEANRLRAADCLETIGAPSSEDLRRLRDLIIEIQDPEIVFWAITLIGRSEAQAAFAVPELATILSNCPYLHIKQQAAWALGRIGPKASGALSVLQDAADSNSPRLSRLALEALESLRGMAA